MGFRIHKGVPIPHDAYRNKYPFPEMKVGDSIFIPTKGESREARSGRNAASSFSKHHKGVRFTARLVKDGLRIWRIA